MSASPMAADIDASDPDEIVEVEFPAIIDVDTEKPLLVGVKEFQPGQMLTLLNAQRRNLSDEQAAKTMTRSLRAILAVIADEDDRDLIEDEMAEGTVTLDDLMDFMQNVVEGLAGRPTKSSSASKPQRTASGPSSQVRSGRRVNRSKKSA